MKVAASSTPDQKTSRTLRSPPSHRRTTTRLLKPPGINQRHPMIASRRSTRLPLAHGNDPRAQAGLTVMYLGGLGVAQDYTIALFWCQKAVERGEPNAQYNLVSWALNSFGVPLDDFLPGAGP
jgi:hypothetical protein